MELLKRYSIHLINFLFGITLVSCTRPVLPSPAALPSPPIVSPPPDVRPAGEDLLGIIEALKREPGVSVEGSIALKSSSGGREGAFVMSILGDDMRMEVIAGGVRAGRIDLESGTVTMEPRLLQDEYLAYMFAVILRDSVLWWNIAGYEMLTYGPHHLVRNSWKKIYVDPVSLVPERQVFRLTRFRTVEVRYTNVAEFGTVRMPERIAFSYGGYDCVLTIGRVTMSGRSGGD